MEDISRELEREIKSYSKPSKSKRKTDKRLILVDDFGNMKPADWVRRTAKLFFYLSLVLGAAAGGYFWLYSELKVENRQLKRRIAGAEKRIDTLTTQKEHLMAKAVLSGGNLEGMEKDGKPDPAQNTAERVETAGNEKEEGDPEEGDPEQGDPEESGSEKIPEKRKAESEKVAEARTPPEKADTEESKQESAADINQDINEKVVDVENFRTSNDTDSGDLLVRFKIMNVTDKPGDITGHIFIVLYPESGDIKKGLVVPTVPVQDGIPVTPDKGQFFSIAHFKPVKFRVHNTPGPDFFKHAEVVVFNQKDDLVLRKRIPMGQE